MMGVLGFFCVFAYATASRNVIFDILKGTTKRHIRRANVRALRSTLRINLFP